MSSTDHVQLANGLDMAYLTDGDGDGDGDGPLAVCLHGFPDTAHTYRHLLPALATAGYRAVAPFNRGYAPSGFAPDGAYQSGALGVDANLLHEALGGDDAAVVIGHDWGAIGAYAAVGIEPDRWRRVVTMAVPPGPVVAEAFFTYAQLRLSWYMFFFQHPLADMSVSMNDHAFIAELWRDWSPGYDASDDLTFWHESIPDDAHLTAALDYYRHTVGGIDNRDEYAAAQGASMAPPSKPTLYLHGRTDGCMRAELAESAGDHLPADGSKAVIVEGAGHFLHLERPDEINDEILTFLAE